MTRSGFVVPVVGLALAIASCGGILLLQAQDVKSHDAQLTLVRTENRLNQLQGVPWEAGNPRFGPPERIRASMVRTERSVVATIDRLQRSAPAAELDPLAGLFRADFAQLDRIYALGANGGFNAPGPLLVAWKAQNVSFAKVRNGLATAGGVYGAR